MSLSSGSLREVSSIALHTTVQAGYCSLSRGIPASAAVPAACRCGAIEAWVLGVVVLNQAVNPAVL